MRYAGRLWESVRRAAHLFSSSHLFVAKFQYTFFDAFDHRDDVPQIPITPFPTLYTVPLYRLQNNTLELTAANFCYTHPQTQQATALDVYLGHLGPLKTRIYQSLYPSHVSTFY